VILLMAAVAVYVLLLLLLGRAAVRGVRAGLDGAAVRWGELLGPAEPGQRTDLEPSLACEGSLDKDSRRRFRQLAAHADTVRERIHAAVRWGELLGPAEMGANQHTEGLHASNGSELERTLRHRFRQLAAHADTVRARIHASARWGELLGPAEPGRPKADAETSLASEDSLGRMDRHRFRQLAARRETRP